MYENMTYENILADMLSRVTSDVDKREGSVIYDALAPCAYQLAQNYFYLNNFIDLVSGDTAIGEYLDRVVADYGITRKAATYAVRKIITSGEVEIGTRWSLNDTTYKVTALLTTDIYEVTCEQLGTIGNKYTGALEALDYVNEVTANLTDIISSGTEIETDDNLRDRFYAQIQSPSTSGNTDNYREWALDVSGVGDAKVFPLWNGNGTVKVLIVNSEMEIDETLEQVVHDYIETVRPVGATVTVDSPVSKSISVTANVILDGTQLLSAVQSDFMSALSDYLKDTIFDIYNVSYAKIGSILLATKGVQDYNSLLVNGGSNSIVISDSEMPIRGTITLTEV